MPPSARQPPPTVTSEELARMTFEEVRSLAAQQKPEAGAELAHRYLALHPELIAIEGDRASRMLAHFNALLSPRDEAEQAASLRWLLQLRQSLLGPQPTPLETVLVDRLMLTIVQAEHADWGAINPDANTHIEAAKFLLKRQNDAHRRLLSAARALLLIRQAGGAVKLEWSQTARMTMARPEPATPEPASATE